MNKLNSTNKAGVYIRVGRPEQLLNEDTGIIKTNDEHLQLLKGEKHKVKSTIKFNKR